MSVAKGTRERSLRVGIPYLHNMENNTDMPMPTQSISNFFQIHGAREQND